jgi:hypothetical protein
VTKISRTGAAIYRAVVVVRSTGPNRPNCEFRVLLRRFAATAWKRAKTSPRTLARTDLAASPWQRPVSHFRPHPAISVEIQMAAIPHPPYSPDLAPCDFFLFPKMKGLTVSFMILAAPCRNIWDTPSYIFTGMIILYPHLNELRSRFRRTSYSSFKCYAPFYTPN